MNLLNGLMEWRNSLSTKARLTLKKYHWFPFTLKVKQIDDDNGYVVPIKKDEN